MELCQNLTTFQVVSFCDTRLLLVQEATMPPLESIDGHFTQLWRFPGGRQDCSDIDAVLLSHSTSLLTFPLLMRGVAQVFATEAAMNIGRLQVRELLALDDELTAIRGPSISQSGKRSVPRAAEVEAWLDSVQLLKYGEKVDLGCGLELMPASAGNGLGSCNWRLWGPSGSPSAAIVTGGNRAATGEAPLDHMALSGCSSLFFPHLHSAASPSASMEDLCQATVAVVEGGGTVLIPVCPDARALEMMEFLSDCISAPLLYTSPVAAEVVARASAMPEWVASSRLQQLYATQPVWRHAELQAAGKLRCSTAVQVPLASPCVILVPAFSLAVGPAAQLTPTSPTVISTSAEGPWQQTVLKTQHLPMHTHISVSEAVEMAEGLKVRHVAVPAWAATAFATFAVSSCERGQMCVDLTAYEEPRVRVGTASGAAASSLRCQMSITNGRPLVGECSVGPLLWGPLSAPLLDEALKKRGIECTGKENRPSGDCKLSIEGGDLSAEAVLVLFKDSTTVNANSARDRDLLSHILTPLLKAPL